MLRKTCVTCGDGDAVVDRDLDVVLLDFEHAAEAAVGDEQPGGVGRGRREDGCAGEERGEAAEKEVSWFH